MAAKQLCVISDLHISAGPLDDCDDILQEHVARFLGMLAREDCEIELVINGDFLDFVQAPPWEGSDLEDITSAGEIDLCYTASQSEKKFDAIYAAHEPVFTALRHFLAARSGNRLVILPGNHDADFFWPGVQEMLRRAICGVDSALEARFEIYLERVYRPTDFPGVWIEHGHQFDPINSFFLGNTEMWSSERQPIMDDRFNTPRLLSCLGTRFLIRFLNGIDAAYPMVDNVKPLGRFLRIFFASGLRLPFRFAVAFWKATAYFAKLRFTNKMDFLSAGENAPDPAGELIERLRIIHESNKRHGTWTLQRNLRAAGYPALPALTFILNDPTRWDELLQFVSGHPDVVDELEPEANPEFLSMDDEEGMMSLKAGFKIDESVMLIDAAFGIFRQHPDVKLLLMGHTHEVQRRPEGLSYLNTGCWTRYYRFGDDQKTRPFSLLKKGSEKDFPCTLLYARVAADAPEKASLETYYPKHDA